MGTILLPSPGGRCACTWGGVHLVGTILLPVKSHSGHPTRGCIPIVTRGEVYLDHGVRCIGHRVVEHPKLLDWRHVLRDLMCGFTVMSLGA